MHVLRRPVETNGTYTTFIRGLTDRAVPMSWPFFTLEDLPKTTETERAEIRQHSRASHAESWEHAEEHGETPEIEPKEPAEENDPEDPTAPSPGVLKASRLMPCLDLRQPSEQTFVRPRANCVGLPILIAMVRNHLSSCLR
jgi:hypothetical protein